MAEFGGTHAGQLRSGCDELGVPLEPAQEKKLLAYLELLCKWNSTYNLSAVRDPEQMITRHVLDSLAIAPLVGSDRVGLERVGADSVADVGSGAGLPGVPLAILYPGRHFALVDSNGKKTRFLFQVKTSLALDNMQIHQQRVESFRPAEPFDAITSRAFASLTDMVTGCRHMLAQNGRFFAMKGVYPEQELAELGPGFEVLAVHPLKVPGLPEQRHLVEIRAQNGESSLASNHGEHV